MGIDLVLQLGRNLVQSGPPAILRCADEILLSHTADAAVECMQLGSGLVSLPTAGPIPRDERALRHCATAPGAARNGVWCAMYTRPAQVISLGHCTAGIGTQTKPLSGSQSYLRFKDNTHLTGIDVATR